MKRLAFAVFSLALALATAGPSGAITFPCGLPQASPLWIEFSDGSVEWRQQVFGKPGIVVATNGVDRAAEMRSLGAHTVYWHMNLKGLAGTPTTPRDPADTEQRANALYERAVASSGCETPIIALNELNGVAAPTPWSPPQAQYRSNVLTVLRTLAGRGAIPALLVPGPPRGAKAPYVADVAGDWYREAATHALIVRQIYFNAQYIAKRGPIVGSRLRRVAMRDGLSTFLNLGIPADRLGLMLGFQSGPGKGGREGLQPSHAWFEVVKREALAAKQVAGELGISTVWSWGWGTFLHFAPEGADPDKPAAACVYLWARDQSLCDGPAVAGHDFNSSLSEGQLILPNGAECTIDDETIPTATVDELAALLGGDRLLATRAALHRLILERQGKPTEAEVRAGERAIVEASFGGSQDAFIAELAARNLTRPAILGAIGDLLARQTAEGLAPVTDLRRPFPNWLIRQQKEAIQRMICRGDAVPSAGAFSWTGPFPFLTLPPAKTTIAIDRRVARRGQRIVLSGAVTSIRPQERVTVYELAPGSTAYEVAGDVPVGANGSWKLTVRPPGKGRTVYRAVSRSAASPLVWVTVRGGGKR